MKHQSFLAKLKPLIYFFLYCATYFIISISFTIYWNMFHEEYVTFKGDDILYLVIILWLSNVIFYLGLQLLSTKIKWFLLLVSPFLTNILSLIIALPIVIIVNNYILTYGIV